MTRQRIIKLPFILFENGLAATCSYKHFLHDLKRQDYSLEQVILGELLFGSWGRHLDAWNPLERSNALLLKYEDLIAHPDSQLQRVAEFAGLTKCGEWVNNFDQLHAADPKMFRQGPAVAPENGFDRRQQQLFSALHGDWMARLGYSGPTFTAPRELRAIFAERSLSRAAPVVTHPAPAQTPGASRLSSWFKARKRKGETLYSSKSPLQES